jgi:hypothetical protein
MSPGADGWGGGRGPGKKRRILSIPMDEFMRASDFVYVKSLDGWYGKFVIKMGYF